MSRNSYLFILIVSLLWGCQSSHREKSLPGLPEDARGEITITGAYALSPFIQACADSFQILYPEARITVRPLGSGAAMRHLQQGRCDLAMVSHAMTGAELEALYTVPLARTGVALLFNSKNPYKELILDHGLTVNDLQKIYTGSGEVTWDRFLVKKGHLSVHAYVREDTCGTAEMIASFLYLHQHELTGIAMRGEDRMIQALQKDSLALGFCNISEAFDLHTGERLPGLEFLPVDLNMDGAIESREAVCDALADLQSSLCKTTYPYKLSRNLYLVAREKPGDELSRAFIIFLLTDGQALVKKMGYSEVCSSLINYNLLQMK